MLSINSILVPCWREVERRAVCVLKKCRRDWTDEFDGTSRVSSHGRLMLCPPVGLTKGQNNGKPKHTYTRYIESSSSTCIYFGKGSYCSSSGNTAADAAAAAVESRKRTRSHGVGATRYQVEGSAQQSLVYMCHSSKDRPRGDRYFRRRSCARANMSRVNIAVSGDNL